MFFSYYDRSEKTFLRANSRTIILERGHMQLHESENGGQYKFLGENEMTDRHVS